MHSSIWKRLAAVLVSMAMVLTLAVTALAKNDSGKEYPVIMVPGYFCFGQDTLTAALGGNVMGGTYYRSFPEKMGPRGIEAYEATISPFSSNWDRACELYACIKGGRVDYGAAHSAREGHARYGRTYEKGLYPQWDADHPIDLIGYSMGSQTAMILASLLQYGNAAEQQADPTGCSGLFKGGQATAVNSVTTVCGTNNGTTFADDIMNFVTTFSGSRETTDRLAANVLEMWGLVSQGAGLTFLIDTRMDQWGLAREPGMTSVEYVSNVLQSNMWKSNDNAFYDMSTIGAKKLNEKFKDNTNCYYFAYSAQASRAISETDQHQVIDDNLYLGTLFNLAVGNIRTESAYGWDDCYFANDGLVNTEFAKAPYTSKYVTYYEGIRPQRGVWINMPTLYCDHFYMAGLFTEFNKKFDVLDFYCDQVNWIRSLD